MRIANLMRLNCYLIFYLHNEKYYEKLGQLYINISYDWIRHDDKISNTIEIEHVLKKFKTIEIVKNTDSSIMDEIVLSNKQNEVLNICKHQIDAINQTDNCN